MKRLILAVVITFLLSAPIALAGPLAGLPCNGNFDGDEDVDAIDVAEFLIHFGRSPFNDPCPPEPPAPVAKTGQTTSHDTGDDAWWGKGVPWPEPRFTDNEDGTVTDNLTGLIWLKNANCFGYRNWWEAIADCNALANGQCGLADGSSGGEWRLPNLFELQSLLDMRYYHPALPNTAGTGQWTLGNPFTHLIVDDYYWSSTTTPYEPTYAWYMYMGTGLVHDFEKGDVHYVWPVRGGH